MKARLYELLKLKRPAGAPSGQLQEPVTAGSLSGVPLANVSPHINMSVTPAGIKVEQVLVV